MVGKLIGYLPGHRGYRVLLGDGLGRVVRSKDVDFDEGNPHLTTGGDSDGDVNDVGDQQNANLPKPMATPMEKLREPTVTPVETTTGNVDVEPQVEVPTPIDRSIPPVTDYWKPTDTKRVPKLTDKARANANVNAAHADIPFTSPNQQDFIELNKDLDAAIMPGLETYMFLHHNGKPIKSIRNDG